MKPERNAQCPVDGWGGGGGTGFQLLMLSPNLPKTQIPHSQGGVGCRV